MTRADIIVSGPVPSPTIDLTPNKIEFGKIFVPAWLQSRYQQGAWEPATIEPLTSLSMHPAAVVFHYGQAIFEGMKAYRWADGSANLFRPYENARRFARSADRMAMPILPEEAFVEGIRALVDVQREWIPEYPGSLYIRPTMIGTEAFIGVRAANEILFYVLTLPTGAYFSQTAASKGAGAVRVFVTTSVGRAAHGGTGNVKAAANYAVTLQAIAEAKNKGCGQVLFLDGCREGKIEEMGGMNIFFVKGKKLLTPSLGDTILPGVTRSSLIQLAPRLGYSVEETEISLNEIAADIKAGKVTEAFACGTAAVVVGIDSFLMDSGEEIAVGLSGAGPVTAELYEELVGIQYGTKPDPFNWIVKI